jgi:hypothetical protein
MERFFWIFGGFSTSPSLGSVVLASAVSLLLDFLVLF